MNDSPTLASNDVLILPEMEENQVLGGLFNLFVNAAIYHLILRIKIISASKYSSSNGRIPLYLIPVLKCQVLKKSSERYFSAFTVCSL
jgi:hypothetical protein